MQIIFYINPATVTCPLSAVRFPQHRGGLKTLGETVTKRAFRAELNCSAETLSWSKLKCIQSFWMLVVKKCQGKPLSISVGLYIFSRNDESKMSNISCSFIFNHQPFSYFSEFPSVRSVSSPGRVPNLEQKTSSVPILGDQRGAVQTNPTSNPYKQPPWVTPSMH